ncbi:ribonuclease H-like protein [Basidiobolus meristosporus CBS 931.73]|uniref:Ribonuclease H-like protein n=1 Tax=Basidiobolus meristosporus CBS 931.73 TaxID=1314790 RepID=A0A1Y1Z9B7_9FUNG|nr:ribonuclease H-like protein [Basidiobolus meristosporus CBS 931.73]|eukprot:ORY06872.1 ribonuclease H-like protein [Basidiobolus meristosporus CBS 931.73]
MFLLLNRARPALSVQLPRSLSTSRAFTTSVRLLQVNAQARPQPKEVVSSPKQEPEQPKYTPLKQEPAPIPVKKHLALKKVFLKPCYGTGRLGDAEVYVLKDPFEVDSGIKHLLSSIRMEKDHALKCVGFDTETTVKFHQPRQKVSLIQLGNDNVCLLIQISRMLRKGHPFPKSLKDILQNPDILKVGVAASGDGKHLEESYGVQTNGIVDLENIAKKLNEEGLSLAKLAAKYADGLELVKNKKKILRFRWEETLDHERIMYAAQDAVSGYRIYKNLLIKQREVNEAAKASSQ